MNTASASAAQSPAASPQCLTLSDSLALDSGAVLSEVTLAYESYGKLNKARDNVVLICHALTMDQYVASSHPITHKRGWWANVVGSGKPIDTDRYHVICANVLGSCMGSTGPSSIDPERGVPWGMRFPVITIGDMVRAQMCLLDALGIERVRCIIGGSMGGMQALACASHYPQRVDSALIIASAARHSAQNIAFHEVGRQAIMADPNWHSGDYYSANCVPTKGLSVARMAAHITYLSEAGLTEKFGRRLQDRKAKTFGFDADFQVESYLRHQGISFVDRFDANSYLYITRAMDYFDLAEPHGGQLAEAFRGSSVRFGLVSFDSDWLYPTAESRRIVQALHAAGARASFVEISSPFGHDSFLMDSPQLSRIIASFIETDC